MTGVYDLRLVALSVLGGPTATTAVRSAGEARRCAAAHLPAALADNLKRPQSRTLARKEHPMHSHTATILRHGRLLAAAMAGTAMLFAGNAASAEEIRIGGTGNALGTMRLLGEAFGKQNPDVKVTVLPSVGTSGAIKAIPKGALDIGLSSRPLTEEERKSGANAVEYARTPLVFAVSTKTPVKALTLDQVADIYNGKMVNWPDGSQIRPVLRQVGDDNTRQIKNMSPALDKALSSAEQRPGIPFATTDQEAADKTESIPGALGATTLALIVSESRPLRALTLNGVEPMASNGAAGKYPHVKQFYFITTSEPSAAVKRYIAFMKSPVGRDILIRAGHWIP
jgi:phosphate transport system substrate-binding protein